MSNIHLQTEYLLISAVEFTSRASVFCWFFLKNINGVVNLCFYIYASHISMALGCSDKTLH